MSSKDAHILIPESVNMLPYVADVLKLRVLRKRWEGGGGYPGLIRWPDVITRVSKHEEGGRRRAGERWTLEEGSERCNRGI